MPPASVVVDAALLATMPLPDPDATTEKHERGTVVVVGGTRRTPGAVRLAGLAALRVGAGKLQLVTDPAACDALAVAVPEALVAPFDDLEEFCGVADAVLFGPGMFSDNDSEQMLKAVVASLGDATTLVVDAGGLGALAATPRLLDEGFGDRSVLTPNPGELARLLDVELDVVQADPDAALLDAVQRFGTTVTLRGPQARTAAPGRPTMIDRAGNTGLGTSGSGDVAVGALAGLLARGASPETAAVWANRLHRRAGEQCAVRLGPVGYLASDLLDELPAALAQLS